MRMHKIFWGGGHLLGTSGAILAFLLVAMVFPALPEGAHAGEPATATPRAIEDPTVSLSVPAAIEFADVMATPSGATTTASATIEVTTTASAGYKLYLYAEENSLKSLNPNTAQSITSASASSLNNFTNNTWGYNLTEGTTAGTTYSALPTTNTTPTQTKDTSTTNSANDTYTLSLGAKVDSTIPSGTYTSILTVAVVAEPRAITYIQDLTLADCQSRASDADFTVTDRRDDNDYTVRYINGACWMTQNLRLAGGRTLTSEESNIVGSWEFPDDSLTLGDSLTEARSALSDNSDPATALEYGGYYNYCAASAGTICSSSQAQDATQDICPKGWSLPNKNQIDGLGGIAYSSPFAPVTGGYYFYGALRDTDNGRWWSSTASSSTLQYGLFYIGSSNLETVEERKDSGLYVRCVRSNPGTLTINFDGNGSTGGSTASQQIAAGNTASLNANGFTRTEYVFTGWNTAADGSGTSYADGADYTVTPATGDATVTLYAQWEEITMQTFTNALCQTLASSANYTVKDARDDNEYTVRHINGTCWMTQNLRLSSTTERGESRVLTSADSNIVGSWEFPNNSLTLGNSYAEARSTISSNTSYGGYYNYCAASAGTVCSSTSAQNATYDICPRGWRLPTHSEQSGITGYVSAFSPVLSGYYDYGALYDTGSYGYWWSATASNSRNQYNLYYNGSSLYTDGVYNKYYGFSVRCVRSS